MTGEEFLVLVENEETEGGKFSWDDLTGERYHFPNSYLGKIKSGRTFIYYRGVRRKGGKRGTPEYFGIGKIGQVWRDAEILESEPKRKWQWYCSIEDYVPFKNPVEFRRKDNSSFEDIKSQNLWQVSVRSITQQAFTEILQLSGVDHVVESTELSKEIVFPELESLEEVLTGGLLLPKKKRIINAELSAVNGKSRRSKIAKIVGDRAEQAALKFIRENVLHIEQGHSLKWVADVGLKPGWDIEYVNSYGELVAVEVKGSTAGTFSCIELTANEWKMAEQLRSRYWVYLVGKCDTAIPKISRIQDPFGMFESGKISVQPINWRLDLIGTD